MKTKGKWLKCLGCGREFFEVYEMDNGRSCIPFGGAGVILEMKIKCTACGYIRVFKTSNPKPDKTPV